MSQIDLSILKKLVTALEEQIAVSEKSKSGSADYITELSKASGIALGIVQEATLLAGDLQTLSRKASAPAPDFLDKILGKLPIKN